MKYTVEVIIEKPVQIVVELFDDPENLYKWMQGLVSFEPISGTPGQPGAKSRLKFQMGKREIEMVETITVRNLPEEFSGTYEADGVFNIVKNSFVPVSENRTKYISEQEFQFRGLMRIMGLLMSGAFKKETLKHMNNFKKFVEEQE